MCAEKYIKMCTNKIKQKYVGLDDELLHVLVNFEFKNPCAIKNKKDKIIMQLMRVADPM